MTRRWRGHDGHRVALNVEGDTANQDLYRKVAGKCPAAGGSTCLRALAPGKKQRRRKWT